MIGDRLLFGSNVYEKKRALPRAFKTRGLNSAAAEVHYRWIASGEMAIEMKVEDRKLLTDWVLPLIN